VRQEDRHGAADQIAGLRDPLSRRRAMPRQPGTFLYKYLKSLLMDFEASHAWRCAAVAEAGSQGLSRPGGGGRKSGRRELSR
jgi:hypothetical protein